jgi:hypothetical protein
LAWGFVGTSWLWNKYIWYIFFLILEDRKKKHKYWSKVICVHTRRRVGELEASSSSSLTYMRAYVQFFLYVCVCVCRGVWGRAVPSKKGEYVYLYSFFLLVSFLLPFYYYMALRLRLFFWKSTFKLPLLFSFFLFVFFSFLTQKHNNIYIYIYILFQFVFPGD